MRHWIPVTVVLLAISVAAPAQACRAPTRQSNAVFEYLPRPPSGVQVFQGRLVTEGEALAEARRAAPVMPQTHVLDAIGLFALLERSDGPPIHLYRRGVHSNCDLSRYGVDHEVWIVGRPLPEPGADSYMMMALERSGRWIDN